MFTGFSDKTTDFLWGIRFNNERSWFLDHKNDYIEYVQKPLNALGKDVYDLFTRGHKDRNVLLHVSRIYRDARRLYGRGPYKDTLWFSIREVSDDWHDCPMLWFDISPEGYGYGLGFYSSRPALMNAFRKSIDANPARMLTLAEAFEGQNTFVLEGEEYRRPKGNPGGLLNRWYNRKYLDLSHHASDFAHYKPEFVRTLAEAYESLMPFYEYLYALPKDAEQKR